MDEQVDIISPENEVIGQCSKQKAHQTGALHRCVVSEVKNTQGEWLFVKQASDRQDAGQLVSPVGGHVRAGESIDDALRREAYEELGLENVSFSHLGDCIFNREVRGRLENHFFCVYEIYSDETPILNEESVSFVWMSEADIKKMIRENPKQFGAAFYAVVDALFPFLKTA